jgi:hypothetical protein
MSTSDEVRETQEPEAAPPAGLSRRGFLGGIGAAAAGLASGLATALPAAAVEGGAAAAPFSGLTASPADATAAALARRSACFRIRRTSAEFWRNQGTVEHPTNGDEARYPDRLGNHSKSLPHNALGEVDAAAYESLLHAMATGDPDDFDAIPLSPGAAKMTSPQCGLAFDLEGIDSHGVAVPPPPALASKEIAGEMVEHYWQALLRDVNFLDYGSSPLAAAAIADLNAFGADFKGPKIGGKVTKQSLFRDVGIGMTRGPYISQFMWLNTPFGVEEVNRKMRTLAPGSDKLKTWETFLAARNGVPTESQDFAGERRYIVNGRDLAQWVHIDVLFQAYFNALLICGTPPDTSADNGGGLGVGPNIGNPYRGNPTQAGFCTFGPPAAAGLMCEVSSRALKATWHKKWQVHRRLRPEEYAGLVEVTLNRSPGRYDGILHASLFGASVLDAVESHNGGSFLLPMAFPEGSPTHPSYTAGHATVAGACVTILKALLDAEHTVIPHPVVPSPDGQTLLPFDGPPLTVEGELNKLASNVATGRNVAGVHWRSDAYESLRLGQAVAVSILRDHRTLHNEAGPFYYDFRGFDGERYVI